MALATVVHPALAPSRRILAVSDIHGNLEYLQGVLAEAAFSPDDVLVVVGDLMTTRYGTAWMERPTSYRREES